MSEKQITLEDVLRVSVDVLRNISVPVALKEQIADPVANVAHDLMMCIEAIERDKVKANESKAEEDDGPDDFDVEEING